MKERKEPKQKVKVRKDLQQFCNGSILNKGKGRNDKGTTNVLCGDKLVEMGR